MSLNLKAALYTFLQARTLLTNLISTNLYPDIAPQGQPQPYVIFQVMAEDHQTNLTGQDSLIGAHLAFTVYALTSPAREQIRDAFKNILEGRISYPLTDGTATVYCESWFKNRQDRYQSVPDGSELGVFIAVLDYNFVFNDSLPTLP